MCARAVTVNTTKSRLFRTGEGSGRRHRVVCEFLFAGNIEQLRIRSVSVVAHGETDRTYAPVNNNPNDDKKYDANTDKTKVRIAFTRLPRSTDKDLIGDQLMWMVDEEEGNDEVGILDSTSDFTFNFVIVGEPGMSTTPRTPITNDDFDPCDL
jgi:hypothetical protein